MKLLTFITITLAISHYVTAQPGSFQDVPSSEYENDEDIQALIRSGADYVVQKGIQQGRLPDSKFRVTQIFSVARQVVDGLNYKFDVELSNGQMTVRANYEVYSQAGSENADVTSYSFDITSASNKLPKLEYWSTEEEEEGEGAGAGAGGEEEEEQEVDELLGGWTEVDVSELNTNSDLRDILNFGVQYVIEQGMNSGVLTSSLGYYIEDVISIEEQLVSGMNYKFVVTLGSEDDDDDEIDVTFEVYQPFTGPREVTSYAFAENEETEEDLLGEWSDVDASEIDTDQNLRAIFDFGLQQVISEGVGSGQLSSPNYQLAKVYSIQQQLVSGMNYRFNVRLENSEGGYATVIFVVNDEFWTGKKELVSYLFLDIDNGETN